MCLDDIYCPDKIGKRHYLEEMSTTKVFGKNMQGAKKLHNGKKYFNGYHIVFIGLSLGKDFRIPISFRIYRPDTGETRIHLARRCWTK